MWLFLHSADTIGLSQKQANIHFNLNFGAYQISNIASLYSHHYAHSKAMPTIQDILLMYLRFSCIKPKFIYVKYTLQFYVAPIDVPVTLAHGHGLTACSLIIVCALFELYYYSSKAITGRA